ncbi:MAG: hypothetical protein ABIR33_11500 [Pyrinomonadaceae bacterium]
MEQDNRLETMLIEGIDSGFSPWANEHVETIKRRGSARLNENGRSEERPQPNKPTNEKDN